LISSPPIAPLAIRSSPELRIGCCRGGQIDARIGGVALDRCGIALGRHGATAMTGISHIAIQEALDGKVVDWLEKVSDEEYLVEATPK
jgi:hypothetical protein